MSSRHHNYANPFAVAALSGGRALVADRAAAPPPRPHGQPEDAPADEGRSLAADGFNPELLLGQEWAARAGRVVVIGESGDTLLDRRIPVSPTGATRGGTA